MTELAYPVEERDAVYYPFIHLRDRAWLNGTLLYFPHLVRMVPEHYPLNDEPWVREYFETPGRRNRPLLRTVDFWQDEVRQAHARLAKKIEEDVGRDGAGFRKRFSHEAAVRSGAREFRISEDRLGGIGTDYSLHRVLRENDLVWYSSQGEFGIHPVLGEAIMATVAMSLAERDGMDVVTPAARVHDVLASRRSDSIYDALVRTLPASPPAKGELVDDLASIVLIGAFDVESLGPAEIARLHRDGEDLTTFRSELARHLATMTLPASPAAREELLRDKAADVLEEWRKHRLSFSAFGRKLFSKDALDLPKEAAAGVMGAVLAGSAVSLSAAAVGGMIVGVVWHAAKQALDLVGQARTSPYRWLNRIHKAGAKNLPTPLWESRIVIPPGPPDEGPAAGPGPHRD